MGLIYWSRPERVYYANTAADAANIGFEDDFIYHELAREPHNRSLKMVQMMRDEALSAFREWDKKPDKVRY
jgi:tRNA(Arg) A34 adenosine deaminase TadA